MTTRKEKIFAIVLLIATCLLFGACFGAYIERVDIANKYNIEEIKK